MSDLMGTGEVFSAVWVSTEVGLPRCDSIFGVHISDTCLIHFSTHPGVSFGEMKLAYYDFTKKAWVYDKDHLEKRGVVTHWMPLPKAPWQPHPNAGDKFKPASSL